MFRTPACLVGLMLLAAPGLAASPAVPQLTVSYGDLNLSRVADAREFLARLETASQAVCGHQPDGRDLDAWGMYRRCTRLAMSHAVTAVNAPLVAQLYADPEATGELLAERDSAR